MTLPYIQQSQDSEYTPTLKLPNPYVLTYVRYPFKCRHRPCKDRQSTIQLEPFCAPHANPRHLTATLKTDAADACGPSSDHRVSGSRAGTGSAPMAILALSSGVISALVALSAPQEQNQLCQWRLGDCRSIPTPHGYHAARLAIGPRRAVLVAKRSSVLSAQRSIRQSTQRHPEGSLVGFLEGASLGARRCRMWRWPDDGRWRPARR